MDDLEKLQEIANNLTKQASNIESVFQGKVFKQLHNYYDNLKDKSNLSIEERERLNDLGKKAFSKDHENKQKSCFINNDECNGKMNAHSIQRKGQLSKLMGVVDGKEQVLQFIENPKTLIKELKPIDIKKASTFYGFCHKHDQIFEPIDQNTFTSSKQEHFLYSFRSFAFSYHNVKSFQDYTSNLVEDLSNAISPIIDSLTSFDLGIANELNRTKNSSISNEQQELLKLVRFEKYRNFLIEYEKNKTYAQLEYLTYEANYLCPIACSSWMVMHSTVGVNFIINQSDSTPYYGYPILISVLPNAENKTTIVLARFKCNPESQFIFKELNNLKKESKKFEEEISKLIVEKTENFYLQPNFWNYLDEREKDIIMNGKNSDKTVFPEKRTEFEMINFFDKKFKLK